MMIRTGIAESDLLRLDDGQHQFEVVDGEVVKHMNAAGIVHVIVGDNLYDRLKPFARQHDPGLVLTDGLTCVLARDEQNRILRARIPDLAFIRNGRITPALDLTRPFDGAPDLAVEIYSPGNDDEDMLERKDDFLNAGAEEFWVIYPTRRELYRYRAEDRSTVRIYREGDTLDAAPLLPGLVLIVKDIFSI
jgi:Uma2 family endonuclease